MQELLTTKLVSDQIEFLTFFQEHEDGHLKDRLAQHHFVFILNVLSEQINALELYFLLFQGPFFAQVFFLKWIH